MAEELKIVLAVDGADKVATALGNTSAALQNTADEAKRAGQAFNSNLKPGVAQAGQVVTNFSRVLSDAPFGFVAIQNNITPLIDSFGYLQKAVSSGGSIFSALGAVLSGPAGISLAIAGVTTLLTFLSTQSKDTKDDVEAMNKAFEAYKRELDQVTNSVEAFSKNQQILLDINNQNIKERFGSNFQADLLSAKAKFISISEELVNVQDQIQKLRDQGQPVGNPKELEAYSSELAKLTNKEAELYKARELQAAANRAMIEEEKRKELERKKALDSVDKTLAKLKEDLRDQKALSLTFNVSTLAKQAKLVDAAIEKIVTKFNLSPENTLKLKVALVSGLGKDLGKEGIGILSQQLKNQLASEEFANSLNVTLTPAIKLDPKLTFSDTYNKVKQFLDKQQRLAEELAAKKISDFNSIIVNYALSSAEQIGTMLGEGIFYAISGNSDGLVAAFKGLFSMFGDAVIQLGKYAILYSTAIQALQNAIKTAVGPAGIAIGIGLIALGTLIKSAMKGIGKTGAFAVGTRYAPGGMALVGERGPEMINLPRGSQVIPAAQTSAMLGGRNSVEVYGVLRGQDIYFSNKKYAQSFNRQT